ncbi:vomeronasal type-1 receptor 4-like [Mus pahari]|uniref:vomeronasal type-1 receptor 4-like n=1 Tax=Mus pahari TaxID=10093 RepID=UPI000A30F418|nr:vomeronasal type-1 receptor 4-like [Mus pahari]
MMAPTLTMGIFLFSQILVGMIGNSSILLNYIILKFTRKHLLSKDLIIEHLTFAIFLSIISRGTPETRAACGFKDILDDIGCKLINYIYRITRGMFLYAIFLLSCFQAITISPGNSRQMIIKHKATKYICHSCSVGWLLHLFVSVLTPARVSDLGNNKNVSMRISYEYCSWFASGNVGTALNMLLLSFSDGLCLGLMASSSTYMVSLLYRHKRKVKHIHVSQHFLNVSPENKATQTILIVVCMFVTSYSFSSILIIFTTYSKYPMLWEVSVFIFLEICFPILCPFVLIRNMKPSFPLLLACFVKR